MLLLPVLLVLLLWNAPAAMDAASASFQLFATAVLPGLFPYMVLALMLASRLRRPVSPSLLILMGWCGGSPAGARLLREANGLSRQQQRFIAIACGTMSPMFLMGTIPRWTGSAITGPVLLAAVLLGGLLTGFAALRVDKALHAKPAPQPMNLPTAAPAPLTFGQAVEQAARTMLLVCGTMAMLRIAATLAGWLLKPWPGLHLAFTTLLEVTCGAQAIANLQLPLALRTALLAGATGFGGMAVLMQNRAVLPPGVLSLPEQLCWQAVHGLLSFLLALGMMVVAGS